MESRIHIGINEGLATSSLLEKSWNQGFTLELTKDLATSSLLEEVMESWIMPIPLELMGKLTSRPHSSCKYKIADLSLTRELTNNPQ